MTQSVGEHTEFTLGAGRAGMLMAIPGGTPGDTAADVRAQIRSAQQAFVTARASTTIAHLGTRIVAEVHTEQGVSATAHIELRIMPEGETEHMIWTIDGVPASKVRVDRTHSVHTSAACMVNRVPDVMGAPAGIRLVSQLGPLKPKFS